MKTIFIYVSVTGLLLMNTVQAQEKKQENVKAEANGSYMLFINNSAQQLFVHVKESNTDIIEQKLHPGDIVPVFNKTGHITSITFGYSDLGKHSAFSALANQEFKAKNYPINQANVFIINANNTINMYQSNSSLHGVFKKQAQQYQLGKPLGSYSLQIHNQVNANGVIVQTVGHYYQ